MMSTAYSKSRTEMKKGKKQACSDRPSFINHAESAQNRSESNHSEPKDNKNEANNTLGSLAKQFVQLIKASPNQTIEIQQASQRLGIQKRRIYDITNVLEGIGYIEKLGKNLMKWIGGQQGEELQIQVRRMQEESQNIQEEMTKVEQEIFKLKNELNTLSNQQTQLNYLTKEDIILIMKRMNVKSILVFVGDNGGQVQILSNPEKKSSQWTIQSGSTLSKLFYCRLCDDVIEVIQNPSFDSNKTSKEKYQKVQEQFYSFKKQPFLKNINQQKANETNGSYEHRFMNEYDLISTNSESTKVKESEKCYKPLFMTKK